MSFYVEAPVAPPAKFGLLSVADVVQANDGPWIGEGIIWENESCGDTHYAIACGSDTSKTVTTRPDPTVVDPITVYSLYECRATADIQRGQEHAMAALNNGESRALESAVWDQMMDVAVDITPTTVPEPLLGLAFLERALGDLISGQAVVHADRLLATLIGPALKQEGNHLETKLGTRVAAGAGYSKATGPGGATPPAGQNWLVGTGMVRVMQGAAHINGPYMLNGDGTRDNTYAVLAERSYVAGWLCATLAIKVTDFPDF